MSETRSQSTFTKDGMKIKIDVTDPKNPKYNGGAVSYERFHDEKIGKTEAFQVVVDKEGKVEHEHMKSPKDEVIR